MDLIKPEALFCVLNLSKMLQNMRTCICYGLNLLPVQIFLNWFIFFKLVHIFQTGLKFLNQFNFQF